MKPVLLIIMSAMLFIITMAFVQQFDLKASIERGKEVYAGNCQSCHMENGEGLPDVFPPVAQIILRRMPNT
jgi:mono/diheme cytochrome c family protein